MSKQSHKRRQSIKIRNAAEVQALEARLVLSAAVPHLVFTSLGPNTAGVPLANIQVAVEDASNTPIVTDHSAVTFTFTGGAFPNGSETWSTGVFNGVATFSNFTINAAGVFSVAASDGADTPATKNAVISPGPARMLRFISQPQNATAGQVMPPVLVQVTDSFGNPVNIDNATVVLTIPHGDFADGATQESALSVNGVATFDHLMIDSASSYTLSLSGFFPESGLSGPTSNGFIISPLPQPDKLAFTQPPISVMTGTAINPAVRVAVEDALGNTLPSDTSTVTLTLNGGTFADGSTTASVKAVNGVATFSNLTINAQGTYSLTANDGVLQPALAPFTVSTFNTVVSFTNTPDSQPVGGLVFDANGNAYGELRFAGQFGTGVIYELPAGGNSTVDLASFPSNFLGTGRLSTDSQGNLFGVENSPTSSIVFELAAGSNTLSTLATFATSASGNVNGGLAVDSQGNVFGVTGGASGAAAANDGILFEVPAGTQAPVTLYSFTDASVGHPNSNLVADASGNIFGSTGQASGAGVIFELANGATTPIDLAGITHSFLFLGNEIAVDASDNLYFNIGWDAIPNSSFGYGSIDELPYGQSKPETLGTFNYGNGVGFPTPLVVDSIGDVFGASTGGGYYNDGCVYEIAAGSKTITDLVNFTGSHGTYPIGASPQGGLALDANRNLVGTTAIGGPGTGGTIFSLAAPAPHLRITNPFQSNLAGAAMNGSAGITVDAVQGFGTLGTSDNATVTLTLNTGTFSDGQTTKTVSAVNGVAAFNNLSINTPGLYTITVSDQTNAATTMTFFVVNPTTTTIATSGQGTLWQSPVTLRATVTPASGSDQLTGTVTFMNSDGPIGPAVQVNTDGTAQLTTKTFVVGDNNVRAVYSGDNNFGASNSTVLDQTITKASAVVLVNATYSSLYYGSIAEIRATVVTPAYSAFGTLQFQDNGVNIGSPITIHDYLNVAEFPGLKVGNHSFTVIYSGDGNFLGSTTAAIIQTIIPAFAAVTGVDAGGTYNGTAFPATATVAGVDNTPASTLEGVAPTIRYFSEPNLTPLSGAPTLPGIYNAQATFAGSADYMSATASVNFTIAPAPASITVTPPAAQSFTAGTSKSVTLGKFVQTGGTAPFAVDVNWGDGSADTRFTQSVAGTLTAQSHKFTLAGTHTVSITVTDSHGNTGNVATFTATVSPAAASKLAIFQQPTSGTAGVFLSPAIVVKAQDAYGNFVTTYNSTVYLSRVTFPAGAILSGVTSAKMTNGVANLSGLYMNTAGAYTLKATAGALAAATTKTIAITAAAAAKLVFAQQPTVATHGVAFNPSILVDVVDAFGNVVTSDASTVTLSLASGSAAVNGTLSAKATSGIVRFGSLSLSKAGTFALRASDGKLTAAISKVITVH